MIKFFVLLAMEILFLIALLFDRKKHREMGKFANFFLIISCYFELIISYKFKLKTCHI